MDASLVEPNAFQVVDQRVEAIADRHDVESRAALKLGGSRIDRAF